MARRVDVGYQNIHVQYRVRSILGLSRGSINDVADRAIFQTTAGLAVLEDLVDAMVQSLSCEGSNVGAMQAHADVDPVPALQVLHTVLIGKGFNIVAGRSGGVDVGAVVCHD